MRKGFTLIEILLVISLIGVFSGGVLVSYQKSSAKQTIDIANQKLRQAYTTARANALANKKDAIICGTVPLDGWVVNLNTAVNPVTFSLYGKCGSSTFPNPVNAEALPVGVNVTASEAQVMFRPLNRGTDSDTEIDITLSGAGGTVAFSISAAGEMLGPTPTSPACRGNGFTCYIDSQCCSNNCSGGKCI